MLKRLIVAGTGWLAVAAGQPQAAAPPAPPRQIAGSFSDQDYPPEAFAGRQQGLVVARLSIDAAGQVAGCEIDRSSGSAALDRTTCAVATQRFRYEPARDAAGRAVPAQVSRRVTYLLNNGVPIVDLPPVAFASGSISLSFELFDRTCAARARGEAFRALATSVCLPNASPPSPRNAITIVMLHRPQPAAAPAPIPASGRLVESFDAELTYDADGNVSSCRQRGRPMRSGSATFSCANLEANPLSAIAPDPARRLRRARSTTRIYAPRSGR